MSAETQGANGTVAANRPAKSGVEAVKENSRALRGSIQEELAGEGDHFSEADKNLLKFHGTYQQEDRDARKQRRSRPLCAAEGKAANTRSGPLGEAEGKAANTRSGGGLGKAYCFMVRCKIPGGRVTADQYLALDALAGTHANGTLRFTTRQGIQFHGVLKSKLKETIASINECLLTTLGACGDVERNVMACPAPCCDGVRPELQRLAARLAQHFAPRTGAYHEIWLNGKQIADPSGQSAIRNPQSAIEEEPLYGKAYLPRKFKTGVGLADDNCIDIYAQDLGLLGIVEASPVVSAPGVPEASARRVTGYNLLVGGGMGMTHGNANTFPFVGRPICFVPAEVALEGAEAVIKLFRDHGNRADRKRARIKYLVHDWGVERFREVLKGYLAASGISLELPREMPVSKVDLHLGWRPQGDGKWFYGLSVENGRVKDEGEFRLRTCLRTLVERFRPELRLTPNQDVLLCGLPPVARPEIERLLEEHGVKAPERLSPVQRYSLSCPAIPTCGLAICESERALPGIIDELEGVLTELGLAREELSVRMTGCPNGCARPYQSDIGLVGRSGDKYTVFVGGRVLGDRLNFPLKDLVPRSEIIATLRPLLAQFAEGKTEAESFGDWCQRVGQAEVRALAGAPAEVAAHGAEECG
jgi:sulfite reductase (ferredoxin)